MKLRSLIGAQLRTVIYLERIAWGCSLILLAACTTGAGPDWPPKPGQPIEHVTVYRDHYHSAIGLPVTLTEAQKKSKVEEWAFGERIWMVDERDEGTFSQRACMAATTDAFRALFWPNRGVIELSTGTMTFDERNAPGTFTAWRIPVSPESVEQIRQFLNGSIGSRAPVLASDDQVYYPSTRRYSVLYNCNHYIAQALTAGGVPVDDFWCLIPTGLWLQLDDVADEVREIPHPAPPAANAH